MFKKHEEIKKNYAKLFLMQSTAEIRTAGPEAMTRIWIYIFVEWMKRFLVVTQVNTSLLLYDPGEDFGFEHGIDGLYVCLRLND